LETNYSLWKTTERLKRLQAQYPPIRKQDGSWVRSEKEKTETFATHITKVFKPNSCEITLEEKNKFLSNDISSTILNTTWPFTVKEMRVAIKNLNPKMPTYDLITNQMLQKLPETEIKYITQLYNAVLRRGFFPPMEDSTNYYDPKTWQICRICRIM